MLFRPVFSLSTVMLALFTSSTSMFGGLEDFGIVVPNFILAGGVVWTWRRQYESV